MKYLATLESVRQHPLPDWYADAKFGIFIHWGPYSVPAYAPAREGDIQHLFQTRSQAYAFAHQPYAEWYQNSLRISGSPVQQHHQQTYGAQVPYEDFAAEFNRQTAAWEPEAWAELFERAGARYVVMVTKHHDGFTLWPSRRRNPRRTGYHAERDLVGELAAAVRRRGLRFGTYYSSPLDWTFTQSPIRSFGDLLSGGPAGAEYRLYVRQHWQELIERVRPDILWSDIGYPPHENLAELFAEYYNRVPEGVINDRWLQMGGLLRGPLGRWLINRVVEQSIKKGGVQQMLVPHCDFRTTEYAGMPEITETKWEACRGIGNSFGYNQAESDADYAPAGLLLAQLVDHVSKNGNLLLNIGPRADGRLHPAQTAALEGMGAWLRTCGAALYGTRPWLRFKDTLAPGLEVRYTCRDDTLNAVLMSATAETSLFFPNLNLPGAARVALLAGGQPLAWQTEAGGTRVTLPPQAAAQPFTVIQFTPWQ